MNPAPERFAWTALMLLVALVFSSTNLVQFTLPKLFWLWTLAAVIVLIWGVRCWRGEVRSVPRAILASGAALLAWWIITTLVAVDPSTALHGLHGRYNGLLTHALYVILFLTLASSPLRPADAVTIVEGLVLCLVPVALYALAQQAGFDPFVWPNIRPGSTIGHPVPLAAMLGLALPFLVAFTLTDSRRVMRWLWAGILCLFLAAVAATLSRGPWVGLAVALVITIGGAIRWRIIRPGRSRTLVILTAAVLAAGIVASTQLPSVKRAAARLATLTDLEADPSFMGRFVYFEAAGRMLRDHPLTGVGFESYALLYPRYRTVEGDSVPADALPSMVHNGYLQMAVTNGVPVLALYLALIAAVSRMVWRACCRPPDHARDTAAVRTAMIGTAFIAAIAGYLVQDMSGWEEVSLSSYFWILLGAAVVFSRPSVPTPRHAMPAWQRRGGSLIAVGTACVLANLAARTFVELRADRHLFVARHGDVTSDWQGIEPRLSAGLQLVPNNARYADEAGLVYLRRLNASGEKTAYDLAALLFDRAGQRDAFSPYVRIHRVDLDTAALQRRVISASSEAARRAAADVVAMDPYNATAHEAVARLALAEGRAADALPAIRQARALRTHHVRYNALEGDALRMSGDVAGSIRPYREETRLLEAGTPDWVLVENKLILALYETGQYQAAAAEASQVLARVPSSVLTRVLLGYASLKMGALDAAREAFEEALALDPANTAAREAVRELPPRR